MWDERVPIHVQSAFYDVDGFVAGTREGIEQFEVNEVGPVDGRSLVHLQCHFGIDTLSWARRGARVVGLDFSAPAINAARALSVRTGISDAEFVVADVYDAVSALGGQRFDIVYTGKGALIWLPDLARWAQVCAQLVAPGGTLYVSEFHPVGDVFGWGDELALSYSYFLDQPTVDESRGTYADLHAETHENVSVEWHHPLGEVVSAIAAVGLRVEFLHEYPFTLYPRWTFLEQHDDGTYWLPGDKPSLPLLYSIRARAPLDW
jgi:SAM-dependent methyltransferase